MYKQAHGIIETLAPVHIGATAGEENGNLNLIFRDQFTQTGIINGSSIRGRLRADMRQYRQLLETKKSQDDTVEIPPDIDENIWYGKKAVQGVPDGTSEALIKLEHASIVWLPVFCPNQPIVWVSCPALLERYQRIANITENPPQEYRSSKYLLKALKSQSNIKDLANKQILFFNLGFITIDQPENEEEKEKQQKQFEAYLPSRKNLPAIVVNDNDMAIIHDMALYRQSRVALEEDMKKAKRGAFFNVEALPEKTILVFPIAIKPTDKEWKPIDGTTEGDIYLGGLESIGFGHCKLTIRGL
jgi:CRISPR-associated protein Cmr4